MITIYTDGSCLTNPGNGGWAAIINDEKEIRKISGLSLIHISEPTRPD